MLCALGVACFAVLVYLPSLNLGFFSDDFYFLGRNAPVVERPCFAFHIFYRDFIPVVHISFAVDWLLAREWAPWYHLSSILIHAACSGLVFLMCRSFNARRWLAASATTIWTVNVHISEAVIWVAARGHSLATLFLVAAFVLLRSRARIWAAVLPWLAALGAKETALFPIVLAPVLRPGGLRKRLRVAALFGSLAIAFALFNLLAKPKLYLASGPALDFFVQGAFTLLRPIGLASWYNFSVVEAVVVYLVVAAAGFLLRRSPAGLVGLGWVLTSSVPVTVQPVYSSRYFYMIAVGYSLLLCALVPKIAEAFRGIATRRLAGVAGAALWALVAVANLVLVQREIADYRILCAPYEACLAELRPHARDLAPGETIVVLDVGPRNAIAKITAAIHERGNLAKLIPERTRAVDGLIDLTDLVNFVHVPQAGYLASPGDPSTANDLRWVLWDGEKAHRLDEAPRHRLPAKRVLAATWSEAAEFFERRPEHR